MAKNVKIGKFPGVVKDVPLSDDDKVADAISAAGLSHEGFEVKRNGETCRLDDDLCDGDTVFLLKKIEGNAKMIKIGKFPGFVKDMGLEDGDNVRRAIELAGLSPDGFELKRNGEPCRLDDSLANGDTVFLLKKIEGNQ